MEKEKYIMALDEGSDSVRTIIVNKKGKIVSSSQKSFTQIYPKTGWVEYDATEIWGAQLATIREAKRKANIKSHDIHGLGVTNQREAIVMWNKRTGLPVYNAISWGDGRTNDFCKELKEKGYDQIVHKKTGLVIGPLFSATKIRWVLKNIETAKKALKNGELLAGNIDSWLIWNLTKGRVHATDVSNASRTLLFNIKEQKWDEELLKIMEVPKEILPEVKPSASVYGNVDPEVFSNSAKGIVPIGGVLGDSQSGLFGQFCFEKGETAITYGTCSVTLINTGNDLVYSDNGMLTTIGWKIGNEDTIYALEGNASATGACIRWLVDNLRIVYNAKECDLIASLVKKEDDQKIYFVPALTGLTSPYWDPSARALLIGIERGTRREHIVKAVIESIAYQANDMFDAMSKDINKKIYSIKVGGGVCKSDMMMQFQSSISDAKIVRPKNIETTAMGVAFMAGLATGYWSSIEQIKKMNEIEKVFEPNLSKENVENKLIGWRDALSRSKGWIK